MSVEHDRSKHIWLWTGVTIFSLAVFFIWFVNTKTFIESTAFNRDPGTDLLTLGKEDFENTVKLINDSDNTGELLAEEKIRSQEKQDLTLRQKVETSILLLLNKEETATGTTAHTTSTANNTTSTQDYPAATDVQATTTNNTQN